MAISRPITGTAISTAQWGIPVTDQLNANTTSITTLKGSRVCGTLQRNVTAGPYSNASPTVIPNMTITFPALNTKFYMIVWGAAMIGTAAGQWAQMSVVGNGLTQNNCFASSPISAQVGYGHNISGTYILGPGCAVTFPSGTVTLNLSGNAVGAGTTWGVGGWCHLSAIDLGPF